MKKVLIIGSEIEKDKNSDNLYQTANALARTLFEIEATAISDTLEDMPGYILKKIIENGGKVKILSPYSNFSQLPESEKMAKIPYSFFPKNFEKYLDINEFFKSEDQVKGILSLLKENYWKFFEIVVGLPPIEIKKEINKIFLLNQADIVIFIGGNYKSLNDFSLTLEMKKFIVVFSSTGGFSSVAENIYDLTNAKGFAYFPKNIGEGMKNIKFLTS